jgi:hypothetical protein
MAQNIADFYRSVQQNDFARQFQFRLVQLANTNFGEDTLVYVETAALPGRAITNVPVPFMGLDFNVPGTVKYPNSQNYTVRFRCDSNYNIRTVLENATFNTFDDGTSTGNYNIARNSSVIIMNLLNKSGTTARQYTLYGAYVVSVGEMSYNLGDSGTIQVIDAVLAYQYWRVTSTQSRLPNLL